MHRIDGLGKITKPTNEMPQQKNVASPQDNSGRSYSREFLEMKTIAIEEHYTTPMYKQNVSANEFRNFYLTSRSEQLGHDIAGELADLGERRLDHMDAAGIDVQVLSFGSPGAQGFGAEIAIPMARDANDRLFEATKAHPDRFAGFAALPTANPEAAADELERSVTKLGFKGTMIHGHTQGSFLDEKKYWVIFERAQALDVPIYLHPTLPHPDAIKAYFQGYEELARAGWGFQVDTSCHFLRIVFAGVFDAYPKLKIILGHLGEGLPFAMHRLNDHTYQAAARRGLQKTPLQYLKDNLLVTTSGNWYEPAFLCTLLALGADNILFAVDWPYEPNTTGMEFLKKLSISDLDREKIAHLNAERILRM
jgi:predicted TIM-barrel fold metal-dependent hydrolase